MKVELLLLYLRARPLRLPVAEGHWVPPMAAGRLVQLTAERLHQVPPKVDPASALAVDISLAKEMDGGSQGSETESGICAAAKAGILVFSNQTAAVVFVLQLP